MRQAKFFLLCVASSWACGGNVEQSTALAENSGSTGGSSFLDTDAMVPQSTGGSSGAKNSNGMTSVTADIVAQLSTASCAQSTSFLDLSCTIPLPQPAVAGQIIDVSKLAIVYHVNGDMQTDLQLIDQTLATCPNGGGWYLEETDNGLRQIALCAKTCSAIRTDFNPRISVYAQCAVLTN